MKIAICVCTCKRPISLGLLLGSLANLRSDRLSVELVELIVIDNNPNGIARYVCQSASSRLSIGLYFDEEPQRGISFARNRAVNVALAHRADFVAFIDDDDIPRPDWLSHLLNKQKQSGADIVFGRWLFAIRSDVSTWIKDNAQFRTSDYRKKNIHTLPCWASTCNVLINSRLLEAMRNDEEVFSPEFAFLGGEDTDFYTRTQQRCQLYDQFPINRLAPRCWRSVHYHGIATPVFQTGLLQSQHNEKTPPKLGSKKVAAGRVAAATDRGVFLSGLSVFGQVCDLPAVESVKECGHHLWLFRKALQLLSKVVRHRTRWTRAEQIATPTGT